MNKLQLVYYRALMILYNIVKEYRIILIFILLHFILVESGHFVRVLNIYSTFITTIYYLYILLKFACPYKLYTVAIINCV